MKSNQLENLTSKELEELLKKRKAEEAKEYQQRRSEYEDKRNLLVEELVAEAGALRQIMMNFKAKANEKMEELRTISMEYGDIKKTSKGGFSLRSSSNGDKIQLRRNTKIEYDERAKMAEDLIKDFLNDMVKKKEKDAYELISSLLTKNKDGDYNPAMIGSLLEHKDRYDDERWQKAMTLFEESHNVILISMCTEFYKKNEQDKDIAISLSYASLPYSI
jgi:hypothetical protein